MLLTTPKDEEAPNKKKLEEAAWYQQENGVRMANGDEKSWKKKETLAP